MTNQTIPIKPLIEISKSALNRLATGYTAAATYRVAYSDTSQQTSFSLRLKPLDEPFIKTWRHDAETAARYQTIIEHGYSFGAFDGTRLIGIAIAEPHAWNRTLWVWEFHVEAAYRGQQIGRRLMDALAQRANAAQLRAIVCETQNRNATAIAVYKNLGFHIAGIDISYYSNEDYPDGEVAVFMKRPLGTVE